MDENTLITIRGRGSVPCKIDTIDFVLTLTAFGKEGKELTEKEEKMRNDLFSAIEKIRKEIKITFLGSDIQKQYERENHVFSHYALIERFSFSCPYAVSSLFDFLSLVKKDDEGELDISYNLSSSKEDENKEKALKLAIENAKEILRLEKSDNDNAKREAEVIAKEMNLTISSVKEIRNEISDIAPYRCTSLEAEDSMVSCEVEIVFIAK